MPSKNSIKIYLENGYYHLYNRGVEKRDIFTNDRDYQVFLHFLKRYLSPPPSESQKSWPRWQSNLHKEILVLAYCLMPNHFHLLVKQASSNAIVKLMRRVGNAYVRYFNERYERVGSLFQGNYKGVVVNDENHLLHLSRYIHLNPTELLIPGRTWLEQLRNYPYSSYRDYLGKRKTSWVRPQEILSYFRSANRLDLKDILSYQSFVEDYKEDLVEELGNLTLEAEAKRLTRSDLAQMLKS